MEPLRIALLGAVEVRRAGVLVTIAGLKQQVILALLALSAPHPVSTERIIDEVWGDDHPANPQNALQAQISHLRRSLGADAVLRRGSGYSLAVDPRDVDAAELERLVHDGRAAAARADHATAGARHREAIALMRGPPLADLQDVAFGREAAARLSEVVLAAHEGLADVLLTTGQNGEVVTSISALVRAHPLRERFHAQLILALYRSGRQAEALRAYQEARRVLVEELGVEPGHELQELERAVLAHDPALDVAAPPGPTVGVPLPAAPAAGDASVDGPRDRLRLVGRENELRALRAHLAEALAGSGRGVLLGGEPGIGKTRLAQELAEEAARRGATVVWGRCYEGRGAPAFWPWTQIVEGLVARCDDDLLRSALGAGIGDIAQIAPEVKELVDEIEPVPPLDPESARFRLYQSVSRFVRRIATRRPLVLVIDDLHWADESSMELLAFLAAEMTDAPLVLATTYRDVDPTVSPELARTLVELSRRPTVRRFDLAGLDRDALADLLSAAGAEPDAAVVSTVHLRTRGNPFFVREILRLLPEDGLDAADAARAMPIGVQGVIRRRVEQLPDDSRRALGAASILGQDFDLGVLAVLLDTDVAALLDGLEPAEVAGIIGASPEGVGRYRFSHGLVNETLYHDMTAGRRARLHQRAAEALAVRHGDVDGPHLVTLASHWFRAVPAAPADAGIDAAVRAALWAQAHVAQRQAEDLLRAAVELIGGLPDGRHRIVRELEVQDQLSQLLIASASYGGAEFRRVSARVRDLCVEVGDHALMVPAMWRLTISHMMSAEVDTGVALGRQILDLAGADDPDPGAALVGHICLGTMLTQRGDLLDARDHFDQAIALCDAGHADSLVHAVTEDPIVFARVFSAIDRALLGDDDRARADADEALAVAASRGPHSYQNLLALWGAATAAVCGRETDRVMDLVERAFVLSAECGFAMGGPIGYLGAPHGWAIAVQGRHAEGGDVILRSAEALRGIGAIYLQPMFHAMYADVCLLDDRPADALASADEGLAVAQQTGERSFDAGLHRLRGEALARMGTDPATIGEAFAAAIDVATAQGSETLRLRAVASRDRHLGG